MSKRVTIRPAGSTDIDAIYRCLAGAFAAYRDHYTTAAFENTVPPPDALQARLSAMTILVASEEAGIVGTIGCSCRGGGEGHLRGMAVTPARHGHGIAQKLLGAAEDELRRAGCERVTLDTTAVLRRAIAFYEAAGYRRTGTISEFFGMELIEYEKSLIRPATPRSSAQKQIGSQRHDISK